jgi:hypothetical protein
VDIIPIGRRAIIGRGQSLPPIEFQLTYSGGRVIMAGDSSPLAPFGVDDQMRIEVTHPDGTSRAWEHNFSPECGEVVPIPPEDITDLFVPGLNLAQVNVSDVCGWLMGPVGRVKLSGVTGSLVRPIPRAEEENRSALAALALAILAVVAFLFFSRRLQRLLSERIAELRPPKWEPGTRALGVLDGTLIGVGQKPLDASDPVSVPLAFSAGPITIGWGARCTIRVPRTLGVAREHARLWVRDDQLMVNNLVPGYSTRVDGNPVDWETVRQGAEIEVGPYAFRCIEVPGARATWFH